MCELKWNLAPHCQERRNGSAWRLYKCTNSLWLCLFRKRNCFVHSLPPILWKLAYLVNSVCYHSNPVYSWGFAGQNQSQVLLQCHRAGPASFPLFLLICSPLITLFMVTIYRKGKLGNRKVVTQLSLKDDTMQRLAISCVRVLYLGQGKTFSGFTWFWRHKKP